MHIYNLSNGGMAVVYSSWVDKSGYMYFEVHGLDGFIHVDSRWGKALVTYGRSFQDKTTEDYTDYPKLSYDLELESFVNDYRRGFHPKPTGYDGYRAVKIVLSSYKCVNGNVHQVFDEEDRKLERLYTKTFKVEEPYIRWQS